jgi:hypothetical protein
MLKSKKFLVACGTALLLIMAALYWLSVHQAEAACNKDQVLSVHDECISRADINAQDQQY